uniref:Uncharacterized protein n=1 Tax=Rhizophora mucronata TaxID=61149 RepID=A0A2P2PAK4_RHIMU
MFSQILELSLQICYPLNLAFANLCNSQGCWEFRLINCSLISPTPRAAPACLLLMVEDRSICCETRPKKLRERKGQ